MFKASFFEEIADRVTQALPPGVQHVQSDIKSTLKQVLAQQFEKCNLVTREAFDTQLQVLERAEARISELEARVDEILAKQEAS